jgi:NADH-quinone oxidoreductase subunit A
LIFQLIAAFIVAWRRLFPLLRACLGNAAGITLAATRFGARIRKRDAVFCPRLALCSPDLNPLNGEGSGCAVNELLSSYLPIVIFIGVALVIGLALMVAPFLVAYSAPDPEKLSAYECGFNSFDDARMKFDVRFYLVSILFIIFDLEVAFLFPWAVSFGQIGMFGFWSMMVFLAVLTIGFIYEWKKGALEWD